MRTEAGLALWSAVSTVLVDQSAARMMDSLTQAGLPRGSVRPSQGSMSETKRKQVLVSDVTDAIQRWAPADRQRFATALIEDALRPAQPITHRWGEPPTNPTREQLERVLLRYGWGLVDHVPYPLELQVSIDTDTLPPIAREGLHKALQRYREGDICGAITPIANAVEDGFARPIWGENPDWGDYHRGGALQAKVTRAFAVFEETFVRELQEEGLDENRATALWGNQRAAVSNATSVLGGFRNRFGDAHQLQDPPHRFAQRALDCGIFVLRAFSEYGQREPAEPEFDLGF